MGSPAQPVFKSAGSEKPAGPKQEKAKLMFQTWPFVQPAIAFGISTFSTYITAVFALAAVALYGGALQVHRPSTSTPSCPPTLTSTDQSLTPLKWVLGLSKLVCMPLLYTGLAWQQSMRPAS